jgi:twitching motility two-component system response regulator PilH
MDNEGKKRILVIDDDPRVCSSISQILSAEGYDVLIASGADDGIQKAQNADPDLIFISLLMTGSNGLKTSKAIHSIKGLDKTPVIMLISYEGELDPRYTATIGIVDVIVKPPDREELVSKTLTVLGATAAAPGLEELSAYDVPKVEEEEYEAMAVDEDVEALEAEEAVLLDDKVESLEPAQDEVFELEEDQGFPGASGLPEDTLEEELTEITAEEELIETPAEEEITPESAKEDFPQEFMVDESELEEEASPSLTPDKDLPEEEFDISEEGTDKDRELEEMLAEEEPAFDESDEDIEKETESREDFEALYQEAMDEEPSRKKTILYIGGLLIIVGLAVGAFFAKKIFLPETGEDISPPGVEEARKVVEPPMVEPPVKEIIKEPIPLDEGKTIDIKPEKVAKETEKKIEKKTETTARAVKPKAAPSKPVVTSKARAVKKGSYSVQVGSFSSEKNAQSLDKKLKQKGYDSFVHKHVTSSQKTYYRVLVGHLETKQKALELSRNIQRKEGIKSFVLRN